MNRFQKEKRKAFGKWTLMLSCLLFFGFFGLFYGGLHSVIIDSENRQKEILETALNRSIVQCYAVEGNYPESISYLEEHYGITYDKKRFSIDYEIVGANLMPEVTVLSKK